VSGGLAGAALGGGGLVGGLPGAAVAGGIAGAAIGLDDQQAKRPNNPLRARRQARFGSGAGRAAGRRIDVARPADARQQPATTNSLFTPGSSQGPATNLQQQENLRSKQERIRRTQGEGAASRFGQTFGLRNSGPGQRAGLPGGQGQGQAGAQDFTAFSDSVAKLQETTKSLTAFATQLNTAADKLAQLQTIEVSLNARVEPIQVILNGASIINEFGDTAKKEIYNQLVTKLEDEFVKQNPDGSINEPTLGRIA